MADIDCGGDCDFGDCNCDNCGDCGDCGDCDCGDCDCGGCDCGDCDCGGCDCGDCGDCDCGGCDCDCGGCNCEGGDCLAFLNCLAASHLHGGYHHDHNHHHLCICWPILCCPDVSDMSSDESRNRTRRNPTTHHHHHNPEAAVTSQPTTIPTPTPSPDTTAAAAVADSHKELLEDPPPTYQEHMEMTTRNSTLPILGPELRTEDGGMGAREDDGVTNTLVQAGGAGPRDTDIAITEGGEIEPRPDILENTSPSTALAGTLDPSKCYVTVKNSERTIVGEKCTVFLHAVDTASKPCEVSFQSLKCEFVSEITGTRASCDVAQIEQSQYEISYQPTIKGRHQLHITIAGQHIRGSPFSIAVMSPVEMLSTPILTISSVNGPVGVTINQRGEMVVAEWGGYCVSVFSPSGEKLRSFGSQGSGQGQFDSPHGVAVDGEGNIIVADRENHHIQKFTPEGQFLAAVGTKGSEPLQLLYPVEVAFNPANNKIYIADDGDDHIQVLNSDLTFSSTFGKRGGGQGRLNRPCGIACDSTGKVYVADTDNHRIQVFTADGKFLATFGSHGHGEGELDTPVSVAVDPSGMVYVVERNNFRVSVFTSEGAAVASFGKRGVEFTRPSGIAVDNSGVVYVCDSVLNLVKAF